MGWCQPPEKGSYQACLLPPSEAYSAQVETEDEAATSCEVAWISRVARFLAGLMFEVPVRDWVVTAFRDFYTLNNYTNNN